MPVQRRRIQANQGRISRRAFLGLAAVGATGAVAGAYKLGKSSRTPEIARKPLEKVIVKPVDSVARHPATQTTGRVGKGAVGIVGGIAENAVKRPIRTSLGALAAGAAATSIANKSGKVSGKVVVGAATLGAIGGARYPKTGIAVGGAALAWQSLSARSKEKAVRGAGNAVVNIFDIIVEKGRNFFDNVFRR